MPVPIEPSLPKAASSLSPKVIWPVLGVCLAVLIVLGFYYARKGQLSRPAAAPPLGATNPAATVVMTEKAFPETQRWRDIPKGLCVLDGTTFYIDGAVRTGGLAASGEGKRLPGAILNIPVNRQGSRIHLLHAAEYAWKMPPGAPYAHFLLHYADGKTHTFDLCFGIHGWDWFRGRNEPDKEVRDENTRIGWTVQRTRDGMHLRAYHTILENPYPDAAITSFDVSAPLYPANLLLFGFSVDNDPRPLAPAYEASDIITDGPPLQSITFTLQDANGKALPQANLAWIAVARRGRVDFPPQSADAQGQFKIEVPRRTLLQIIYTASGPEGRQAAGILAPDENGSFPQSQTIELKAGN